MKFPPQDVERKHRDAIMDLEPRAGRLHAENVSMRSELDAESARRRELEQEVKNRNTELGQLEARYVMILLFTSVSMKPTYYYRKTTRENELYGAVRDGTTADRMLLLFRVEWRFSGLRACNIAFENITFH